MNTTRISVAAILTALIVWAAPAQGEYPREAMQDMLSSLEDNGAYGYPTITTVETAGSYPAVSK